MHPFVEVFGLNVPMYTVLFITAVAAAWLLTRFLAKKSALSPYDAALVFLMGASGGLIGVVTLRPVMHTVRIVLSWENYRHMSLLELAGYATGELVFYGGLLGGLTAIVLFCRKFKIDLVQIFDILTPAVALAHAIGRAGCFLAGCCFGMRLGENHPLGFMAVYFPEEAIGPPAFVPILPTQLMESGFLLVLCMVMVFSFLRFKKRGLTSALYLFAYPVWRFFLEFFRADAARGQYGPFTTSQYISIGLFVFAVFYVIFLCRKQEKPVERTGTHQIE